MLFIIFCNILLNKQLALFNKPIEWEKLLKISYNPIYRARPAIVNNLIALPF
jgi:hypothetical protein